MGLSLAVKTIGKVKEVSLTELEEMAVRVSNELKRMIKEELLGKVEDFYAGAAFHLSLEIFRRRVERELNVLFPAGEPDAVIATLGFTPQPLILLLYALHPRYFFVLASHETAPVSSHVLKFTDELGWESFRYQVFTVKKDDPVSIEEEAGKALKLLLEEKETVNGVCVDITGGTKLMSAKTAVYVYNNLRNAGVPVYLTYVASNQISRTISEPGSEKLVVMPL